MAILSRREKAALQLRQDILNTAARLFREKGFLTTTLDDVATQLTISKANIYNYFRNKKYLLYEVLLIAAKKSIKKAILILTSSASPKDKLKDIIRMHVKIETDMNALVGGIAVFERRNLPVKLIRKYNAVRREYEQIFLDVFEEAINAGQIKQCNTRLMAQFILGMINSIPHWFKNTGPLSPDDVANELLGLIECGIVCKGELDAEDKN